MTPTTEKTPATAPVLWKKLVEDWLDEDCVGVDTGKVTTEVCVKTWPSDVWTTKERLEVKELFGAEEEVGAEEVFAAELVLGDAALEVLDVVALEVEEALEVGELTGLEVEGAAVVAGGDVATSGVDVGVSLVVVAAVSVGWLGVVAGTVARGGDVAAAGVDMG